MESTDATETVNSLVSQYSGFQRIIPYNDYYIVVFDSIAHASAVQSTLDGAVFNGQLLTVSFTGLPDRSETRQRNTADISPTPDNSYSSQPASIRISRTLSSFPQVVSTPSQSSEQRIHSPSTNSDHTSPSTTTSSIQSSSFPPTIPDQIPSTPSDSIPTDQIHSTPRTSPSRPPSRSPSSLSPQMAANQALSTSYSLPSSPPLSTSPIHHSSSPLILTNQVHSSLTPHINLNQIRSAPSPVLHTGQIRSRLSPRLSAQQLNFSSSHPFSHSISPFPPTLHNPAQSRRVITPRPFPSFSHLSPAKSVQETGVTFTFFTILSEGLTLLFSNLIHIPSSV